MKTMTNALLLAIAALLLAGCAAPDAGTSDETRDELRLPILM